MSIERKEVVKCPKCGKKDKVVIWQSLNGDIDPKAKQKLIDGTLFRFECKKCGLKINLDYPILYHDMANRAMVYYVKEESISKSENVFEQAENQMGNLLVGYKKRIVTSTNDLREKAIIFANGLDDRIVEIVKAIYRTKALEQHPDAKIENVYFYVYDNHFYLQFTGENSLAAEIPIEIYKTFEKEFVEKINASHISDFSVDTNWVNSFFAEINEG